MGRKRRSKNLIKTHHWRPPEARDTATAHTTSARRPAVPQSYLGLMSGAPAVCLPSFSAFPHEQLRRFQSKSNCQTSDPRIFCRESLPALRLSHPRRYTVISHALTRASDTSDCAGVRSDQTCRRRLYAHSDTQRRTRPLERAE